MAPSSPIRILVVDDEPDLLEVSKEFLELDQDISADTASSAAIALDMIELQEYDSIVSDYRMPGKDGIQLLKDIRSSGNTIPFILFTGKGREEVVIEALNAGADYYLQKGGDPRSQFAELRNMIEKAFNKHCMEMDLIEKEEKFENIFNSTNDSILILDLDGNFLEINEIGCDWLGYTKQEMLKKNIGDIYSEEHAKQVPDRMKEVFEKGAAQFETEWVAKSGKRIPVENRARRIKFAGRTAVLSVARNITERKRAEEALHKADRKLNILSNITRHDINNQLTVLKGNLTLLEKKQLDHPSDDHIQKVKAAAKRISAMIQFTKEYEDIGVHAAVWQDVRTLIDTSVREVTPGSIKVVNDVPVGTEVFVDPMINKVFHNLIDNAVRHGGNVTTIHFSVEDVDGSHAIICEDDGVGIAANMKEKIFMHVSGNEHGFGLFLSHEILAITGITIKEDGEPGDGAKFIIYVQPEGLRIANRRGSC